MRLCSISFSRSDRIRLIDISPEVCQVLPARLGPEWVSKVTEYSAGIQEIKFHGYPWATGGKETMRVRELLLTMLGVLEEEGWTVYASIDQNASGGDQNTSETDTVSLSSTNVQCVRSLTCPVASLPSQGLDSRASCVLRALIDSCAWAASRDP